MNTILVTGTTSGIGKAFAEKFAANGDSLILVSRDEKKLELQKRDLQETYHAKIKTIACDLSKDESVLTVLEKCKAWNMKIDILINNAVLTNVDTSLKQICAENLK